VFLYVGALPALLLARRADRIGRRRVLLICVVAYTLSTAATAFAPTIEAFVGFQFLARVFLNAESAVVWTIAAEELPASTRGFGFGFLAMTAALGTGFAAILYGGALEPAGVSWRVMYLVALPPLVVAGLLRRRLRETRRFETARGAGSLAQRWHEILRPPWFRLLALVAVTAFLLELTTQASVFAIDFLQTSRGLSASAANFMLVAAGAPGIPFMLFAGSLSDRYGRRLVGCGFAAIGIVGAMAFFWGPGNIPFLVLALGLTIAAQLGSHPALAGYAMELFPTSLRGQAGAWAACARVSGNAASLALGGALLAALDGQAITTTILAIGPLLAIVIVALFFPDTHGRELEETSGQAPVFSAPAEPTNITPGPRSKLESDEPGFSPG
jgi:putative MFS transporter